MKIPTYHKLREQENDRFMTPMIDVVFLLLIFFVCASSGRLKELLMPTPLAAGNVQSESTVEEQPNQDRAWIKLEQPPQGELLVHLNNRQLRNLEELELSLTELAEITRQYPVVIDADEGVPMQTVLQIYDLCQSAQYEQISFAIDPPQPTPQ